MNKLYRKKYFRLAIETAIRGDNKRQHRLGAVGVRHDGAIVKSNNLPNRNPEPQAHAEARVVKKMDQGGRVYVVRVLRDGTIVNARPCAGCKRIMLHNGIKRCYYSITEQEYGVLEL